MSLVKSQACLIWRRVARGNKEKVAESGVKRSSHPLPPFPRAHKTPFINSFKCPERPPWPLSPGYIRVFTAQTNGAPYSPREVRGAWDTPGPGAARVSFLGPKLRPPALDVEWKKRRETRARGSWRLPAERWAWRPARTAKYDSSRDREIQKRVSIEPRTQLAQTKLIVRTLLFRGRDASICLPQFIPARIRALTNAATFNPHA